MLGFSSSVRIFFNGTGLWALAERLVPRNEITTLDRSEDEGRPYLARPNDAASGKLRLKSEALSMLLGGIDLKDRMAKERYER